MRRGLDPLLLPDKAVRVDLLDGAGPIESRDLLFAEFPAHGVEVVLKLVQAPGAYDRGRHALLPQEPVQRDLGVGLAGLLGDLAHDVERAPVALRGSPVPVLLHRLHGLGYARALHGFLAAPVLAREEAASQRAPRYDAEALLKADGKDLALYVPLDERVLRLQTDEPLQAPCITHPERFHQLPAREVRDPDVADLAGPHEVCERRERLFQRRGRVPGVDLVEVYVVGAEAGEARVAAGDDVLAREADVVWGFAPREGDLRFEG